MNGCLSYRIGYIAPDADGETDAKSWISAWIGEILLECTDTREITIAKAVFESLSISLPSLLHCVTVDQVE